MCVWCGMEGSLPAKNQTYITKNQEKEREREKFNQNNDDDDNVDDNEEGLPFMNNVSDEFNLTDQIPQEYMMLVMEDCGLPITDCLQQIKPLACVSIVKQLIIGLMIAETVFQFEHRDLHGGNVLVQTTNKTKVNCNWITVKIRSFPDLYFIQILFRGQMNVVNLLDFFFC